MQIQVFYNNAGIVTNKILIYSVVIYSIITFENTIFSKVFLCKEPR
ncbi:hypothetical protein HMPREF9441_00587 [Paraprevotella clara YIT 11840]|uniref:Uncharacterized protein n=1 Tax=Paraprevotella clara YIT 11840 TaxID=762968 RepID=G5SML2_9BACT|nr:hypothetical protein HMPREF9441_00587 [Paraprevotella clara YIT 11840]